MFKENGKLKLLIIVGTRSEIIRLSEVIKLCRKQFDTVIAHTGQNYDYTLNGIFFDELGIDQHDYYFNAVGANLGETMGNIISKSYNLMVKIVPDAVLVLGDTNSCLSVVSAKRLYIPIFHMEVGNRCKDECLPEETNRRIVDIISDVNMAYSEHARRYLADCGPPKERTYVTGLPMAEVLEKHKEKFKYDLKMNINQRGSFTELVYTLNCGQVSVDISKPEITKGQHWHNSKWKIFMVIAGHGLIQERNINTGELVEFDVTGEKIEAIYMIPGWTHNIINLSETENLVTVMYCNEIFDANRPDTYREDV